MYPKSNQEVTLSQRTLTGTLSPETLYNNQRGAISLERVWARDGDGVTSLRTQVRNAFRCVPKLATPRLSYPFRGKCRIASLFPTLWDV